MRRKLFNVSVKFDMSTMVASALDLARRLFMYGESDLAERAVDLPPAEVLEIGRRIVSITKSGEAARLWPDGPGDRPVVLATIEWLEGAPRRPQRATPLPETSLPVNLQASKQQLQDAESKISKLHFGQSARDD
jgi:hypothetical protein